MFRESIPQFRGDRTECTVTHGAQFGFDWFQAVGVCGAKGAGGGLEGDQFLEVGGGVAMDALVS